MRDLAEWLEALGLGEYAEAFAENRIDFGVLPRLTGDDLKDIGVVAVGDRRKLLDAIAALSKPDMGPGEGEVEEAGPTNEWRSSAGLDPEDMREVISAYQNAVVGEIDRYEGHVAKFMGDGVLAYFGWPKAHEDEAERAVRAGLAVIEAVSRLTAPTGDRLAARIGIATGLVVVGDLVGEGAAQEEAVVGDTPNLAARLQERATPNSVVISPSTMRLIGALFEAQDLGYLRLKGLPEPVRAWRVIGEQPSESRFEATHATGLTPFIGRDQEIDLLLHRWELAKNGEGQVVLLSGEPGIGKSRITQRLRERIAGEPHTRLRYQCSPYHTNSALYPVISQLEFAAGFAAEDTPPHKLDKLEALLARSTEAPAEAAPLFASLLSIPSGERYALLDLTPQRQKEKTLEALTGQLAGLAAHQPVLMSFEDTHWSDPTTRELLDLSIDRVRSARVLAVITFRPEFTPPWGGHGHVTALALNRLGRRHCEMLIDQVTAGKALPREVVDQIAAKTDGVPLFVEELTKTVLESGLLQEAAGRYLLDGPLPRLAIPTTLQDSLTARLDQLGPVKEVAQIGAVIGREFTHELLAAVADLPDAALEGALKRIIESELVYRRGTPPEAHYEFKHALIRDVAYGELLRARRQQLHGRIAQVLRDRLPSRVEIEPELVAHHYTQAGLAEPAATYWQSAAQRAVERSASLEAISHATKGLECIANFPDEPSRVRQELALQIVMGLALMSIKGYGAAETEKAYARARELSERLGDPAQHFQVLRGQGQVYMIQAKFGQAREFGERCLSLAEQTDTPDFQLEAHHLLWTTSLFSGDLKAASDHITKGLVLSDSELRPAGSHMYPGGHDAGVCGRAYSGWVSCLRGYPDAAITTAQTAVTLAERLDHPPSLCLALFGLAMVHQFRREPEQTLERVAVEVKLAADHGLPFFLARGRIIRGWALVDLGQREKGLAEMRHGLDAYRATGAEMGTAYWLALLGEACGKVGEIEEGRHFLKEAVASIERLGEHFQESEVLRLMGELSLTAPEADPDMAEQCFRQALAAAHGQGARLLELRAAMSLGRLYEHQHRAEEASASLAPIFESFTEGFDTTDLQEAKALLDNLA
jgi:class 3 adenylate cyclase/predicted ATPase